MKKFSAYDSDLEYLFWRTKTPLENEQFLPFLHIKVVTQNYACYVNQAHVIRGNDVLMKCDIPSFVTDFVNVFNWQDNEENVFTQNSLSYGRI